MKIERIVVFGCSYSNGEEILYSELGPELSELHRLTAHDPRIFFKAVELDKKNVEKLAEVRQQQYSVAWPQKLADKLGVECLNLSESGNSMQKMLWQFLDYQHKQLIRPTDLVLFAATKAERSVYFREHPMSFQVTSSLAEGIGHVIGVSPTGGPSAVMNKDLDQAILTWFNDDRLIWDYLTVLQSLALWKQQTNLFVIPAMTLNEYDVQDYNVGLFADLMQGFKESDLYLTNKGLDNFKRLDSEYLPWGHPGEIVHDRYAEHLYEILNG